MQPATLTPTVLQNLKPPAAGILELHDPQCRGLVLRVFPSGRATWTLRYRPAGSKGQRRMRLGEYPGVGLAETRRRAERERGKISDGQDPQAERHAEREKPTLDTLIDRYLEMVAEKKKPRTLELYTHYLRRLVPPRLASTKAEAVTGADIDKLHRKLGADRRVTANRVIVTISGVYTFSASPQRRLIPEGVNPARGIEKYKEESCERFLSSAELARLGETLRQAETEGLTWPRSSGQIPSKHDRKSENQKTLVSLYATTAIRLLLFTGCRLREILHLRWTEVDFERGLLLLPDSKTGRKTVVLNAPALQVLADLPRIKGCDFVIFGDNPEKPRADLQKPWALIKHHANLNGVRLHDLRHTHASVGAGAGVGLPIIGKLLGHKHASTTEKYAHLDADPLRRASNRIGNKIAAALGTVNPDNPNNVRSIR
jgi:integrase